MEMSGSDCSKKPERLLVLYNQTCLLHKTVELLGSELLPAYESPERLNAIYDALAGHDGEFEVVEKSGAPDGKAKEILDAMLAATHDEGYIQHLQSIHSKWVDDGLIAADGNVLPECFRVPSVAAQRRGDGRAATEPPVDPFACSGYYAFDMSTGICKDTWVSVAASANLAIAAVHHMLDEGRDVLALCRPPGHHCTTKMAGGYCYVNNAAVAVEALRSRIKEEGNGPITGEPDQTAEDAGPKIGILDLDFHHGNGTQDAFYEDPHVLYVSIHGQNEYPYYTGFSDETGAGRAAGTNVNLPLKTGASVDEFLEFVDTAVQRIVAFVPQYLFLSLGFDTFNGDPLGYFMIETEDYERIARRVRGGADGLNDVPAVILLEGGYVVEKLGENMLSFLRGWCGN